MAIKTASKRAYLTGEGEQRKKWGITTVIMNKRGNACPKCLPFVGKVLIDDVWSGGKASDGPYQLMSSAMEAGLYHPNCKDSHTTYFAGLDDDEISPAYTKKELENIKEDYRQEQKRQYAGRMAEQFDRLSEFSLDPDNKKVYAVRKEQWENVVANGQKNDILNNTNDEGVLDVHSIGKINKEIYRCIAEDILTDEVVITNNQIQHIMDRHPNDYERFSSYFGEIVKNPDYIIEANKPNTALLLKEIRENGEVFKTVLRLVTSKDNPNYKNSIITFMKIDEKEWNRLLRNKTILYKKE